MGAFILCSCLIDAVAGFEKGCDTKGVDYIDFVKRRLQSYNPKQLYEDLRCKLVHGYSEGGSYLFTDARPDLHGGFQGAKTVINLENFIADIQTALDSFASEIASTASPLRGNAINRYKSNGIIEVAPITVTVISMATTTAPLSGA